VLTADLVSSVLDISAALMSASTAGEDEDQVVDLRASDLTMIDIQAVEAVIRSVETRTSTTDNAMYRRMVDTLWASFSEL
jgi:hypothetical protein